MRRSLLPLVAVALFAAPLCAAESCGHGTKLDFVESPKEAAALAKKEQKLVMVLHVSGHFEDPGLTWNNAEALRVGALNNAAVGKYVNEYFVSSYQKVATFKIVGGAKQGGNVAAYFCAPDGRVLHCVAGPVDAQTFLKEAKWVVETTKTCMKESTGKDGKMDGAKFKEQFRKAHAEKLRQEFGIVVEAVTYDPPDPMDVKDALTYRDPTGRPLAPKLPPPPIDGPDVTLGDAKFDALQKEAAAAPGNRVALTAKGRRVVVTNQSLVHQIMAAHSMAPIERVYGTVFENILGEKISTKPVDVVQPFTWIDKEGNRLRPLTPNGAVPIRPNGR